MKYLRNKLYIGTDELFNDLHLEFSKYGNAFIHGPAGSGKTFLMTSIFRRLRNIDVNNKYNIALWSFKPWEFDWCREYLYEDAKAFMNYLERIVDDENHQSIIFIDELKVFLDLISPEEIRELKDMMKRKNTNFICCSQHMYQLIDEFKEYADTRICMNTFGNKEESAMMMGVEDASKLLGHMHMIVSNKYLDDQPIKLVVSLWLMNK